MHDDSSYDVIVIDHNLTVTFIEEDTMKSLVGFTSNWQYTVVHIILLAQYLERGLLLPREVDLVLERTSLPGVNGQVELVLEGTGPPGVNGKIELVFEGTSPPRGEV